SEQIGMGFWESFGLSFLGSTAVFFILFFLLVPVLNLLKKWKFFRNFALAVETYIQEKAEKELVKRGSDNKLTPEKIKIIAVFLFVAIPLPMTGVWMGTGLAVFMNLKFKQAVLPIIVGNLIAGLIISLLAELFLAYVDIILYVLLGLAAIFLAFFIYKILKKSKEISKAQKEKEESKQD
ncbi:MAG: small multi-drug export protein, partial [Clostridia bacterium]|nr:small multi-drug export protein [Clostridia bacterium]